MDAVEGRTLLPVSASENTGPGAISKEAPFYNPAMRRNRDLTLLLVRHMARERGRELDIADALCGAGARSLRFANEVDAPLVVHANDGDPAAIEAMLASRARNGIAPERLKAKLGNAFTFLSDQRFDLVDIDPFGSPAPFLDAAVRATRHNGYVCLTATDTAALCGTYPRVCRRRYAAWHGMHQTPWGAEAGLRILAGAAVMAAGRLDRAATPVWSVFGGHWMRVVLRVTDGRGDADRALRTLGYADATDPLDLPSFVRTPPAEGAWAGPLWTGAMHDATVLTGMQAALDDCIDDRSVSLLDALLAEAEAPAWWIEPKLLRRLAGGDAPRRDKFMATLEDAGFMATRTHMDPVGIRTNADMKTLRQTVQALAGSAANP